MHSSKLKSLGQKIFAPYLYGNAYTRAIFTILGLSIQECKVCCYQFFTWKSPIFSIGRVIKYFLHGLLRIVLGRSIRISYGYKAEDRLIESLLKPIVNIPGYYVDVGCNEPRFLSNTFLLYRRGWRGICIDPNEKLIRKHRQIRPQDQAICAFISNTEKEVEFLEFDNQVLSTSDERHIKYALDNNHKIIKRKQIISEKLTTILDKVKAPLQFDLLSIDAEGNDLAILQSLDFNRYSPQLIVVEADDFDPSNPTNHELYTFLTSKNYFFHGSILTNLYFLKDKTTIFS